MPSPAPSHRRPVPVTLNGVPLQAAAGESVAGFLIRLGHRGTRRTMRGQDPRGYFCGMGACFECVVQVDHRDVQACLTYVAAGMCISTSPDPA